MILSNLILLPAFMQRWVNAGVLLLKWYLNNPVEADVGNQFLSSVLSTCRYTKCMIVFDRVDLYID